MFLLLMSSWYSYYHWSPTPLLIKKKYITFLAITSTFLHCILMTTLGRNISGTPLKINSVSKGCRTFYDNSWAVLSSDVNAWRIWASTVRPSANGILLTRDFSVRTCTKHGYRFGINYVSWRWVSLADVSSFKFHQHNFHTLLEE